MTNFFQKIKLSWHWQDYLFAAAMTGGMLISAFLIPLIAPRFLELIFWAPVGGIFLTLGMARLEYRGSVALMIVPLALILALLSPLIGGYLGVTASLTELVLLFRGSYRSKRNRCLGNLVFFTTAIVIDYLLAAVLVGDEFARLLNQPLYFAGLVLAGAIALSSGLGVG